jgi:serine/threonine protein phosphatase PrpC
MVHPSERLVGLLSRGGELLPLCHRLVEAANKAGGEDNITVLLARLESRDD